MKASYSSNGGGAGVSRPLQSNCSRGTSRPAVRLGRARSSDLRLGGTRISFAVGNAEGGAPRAGTCSYSACDESGECGEAGEAGEADRVEAGTSSTSHIAIQTAFLRAVHTQCLS